MSIRTFKGVGPLHTDGSLELVSCSNPNLDASELEICNRFWNTVLKTILDRGRAQESKIPLDLVADSFDFALTVIKSSGCHLISLAPSLVLVVWDIL